MYPTTEKVLKVCRKCIPNHAVNCGGCFGFGVVDSPLEPFGSRPIGGEAAERAIRGEQPYPGKDPVRCPICGGHPGGRVPPPGVEEVDATDDDTRVG